MDRTDLTVVDLHEADTDPELVRLAYETVLRPSFSESELPGPSVATPGDGQVLSVLLDGDEPLAAALSELDPNGVSLLGYLATRPTTRSMGAGTRLLTHLRGLWESAGCALVLAEVHDPRCHPETTDERPGARLRFYGRNSCEVLGIPWVQPALSADTGRVPGMLLLVTHRAGQTGAGTVAAEPVLHWALGYFIAAEGEPPHDPQGQALLALMRERDAIPVLPIERWNSVELLTH